MIQERYRPQLELSARLRFHVQTAGSELTADKPELNLVRVTIQALAAVFGGTQSLHTNSYDEALSIPTEFSASLAVETQVVFQKETDLLAYVDPFRGSEAVEALTDDIMKKTRSLMMEISDLGGAISAIKLGFQKAAISAESLKVALAFEKGEFSKVEILKSLRTQSFSQNERIGETLKEDFTLPAESRTSDFDLISDLLSQLKHRGNSSTELMEHIKKVLLAGATLGEIMQTLKNMDGVA